MTTSLRSRAHFERKLQEFDLLEHKDKFTAEGWYTMLRLAQSCGHNPDHVEAKTLKLEVEDKLRAAGIAQEGILDVRALYWECVHAMLQENRQRFSTSSDEFLIPFNDRERMARRKALKEKLSLMLRYLPNA